MMDDRVLVSQILDGNMQAFRTLIKLNERLVAHMVGRIIKNKEEHEEVCQDVFLKVYNRIGEFNFQSKLSTWIATIAYRHAINATRRIKQSFTNIPDDEEGLTHFVSAETPEQMMADRDMDEYVLRLIESLPPQYKVVLTLYHVEGMSYEEIGKITEMPEGTVKNYLFRARTLLKGRIMTLMSKEPGL
jgi:RNA polymerase sigma factor (sigma-70 family)